jgi:hypothetical protein
MVKEHHPCWVPDSYSGGRDQEDHGSIPAWANSLQDPISKKSLTKNRAGGAAQDVGAEFKPKSKKKKKRKKNAIQNHTNVQPGTQEEEIILKDKFLTHSALNIHRKLQKLVAEGGKSLDQVVQVATTVFHNRDQEKERRKDQRQEVLIAAMWVTPSGVGPNPWPYFLCGQKGHFRRVCPLRQK